MLQANFSPICSNALCITDGQLHLLTLRKSIKAGATYCEYITLNCWWKLHMPKILLFFFPGFLAEGMKEWLRFSAGPGVKCCRSYVTQEFYLRPKRAYCNPGILSNLRPAETTLAGIHGEFLRGTFMEYGIQRYQVILEPRTVENKVSTYLITFFSSPNTFEKPLQMPRGSSCTHMET